MGSIRATRRSIRSTSEGCFEEARRGADRQLVGTLLVLVFRYREAMAGAAVEFHLKFDLGLAQFLVDLGDLFEGIGDVLGSVQDQELALGVLRPTGRMVGE